MGDAFPPPAVFNNIFDECSFSIISNFFDNNDSYALSTHKWKMCEQNASYLVKKSELGAKQLNKINLQSCSKNTKMAIEASTFSKLFGKSMPPDLPKSIVFPQFAAN